MTIILRRIDPPRWQTLGPAGLCRVGLTEIVAVLGPAGDKRVRVVILGRQEE